MKQILIVLTFLLAAGMAQAEGSNIKYPVAELGNCQNQAACKTYCDAPANSEACLDFSAKNNLMSEAEIALARKMASGELAGPGGCTTEESCEAYCDNLSHISECLSFAEKNNLMAPEELAEVRRIDQALKSGVTPPPCNNEKECDVACQKPENMEICINFALAADLMSTEEKAEAEGVLRAIKQGFKPPPCSGAGGCEEYCSREENFKQCADFAIAAGFMDPGELQQIEEGSRDFRESLASASKEVKSCISNKLGNPAVISPGPEAGRAMQECFKQFGSPVMGGGGGPGGCKDEQDCQAFCSQPENRQTCYDFARENNLMPEGEAERMEQGRPELDTVFQSMPSEVEACLADALGGQDEVDKIKSGEIFPSQDLSTYLTDCFRRFPPASEQQNGPQEGQQDEPQEGSPDGPQDGQPPPENQDEPPREALPETQTETEAEPVSIEAIMLNIASPVFLPLLWLLF